MRHREEPSGQSSPVRVLHVLPSLFGGGMEHATTRLIAGPGKPHDRRGPAEWIAHGLCLLGGGEPALLARCRSMAPTWVLGSGNNGRRPLGCRSWWRLRQIIRHFRPDVVHARTTGVWVDAVMATVGCRWTRLLLSFHGREHLRPLTWRRRWLSRWTTGRADAVLSVSREAARMMQREWGVHEHKMLIVPNGVDVDRFRPADNPDQVGRCRSAIGLQANDRVVICVANLHPIKGIDVLLRAWRQVAMVEPGARLLIVGDGPLRAELEGLASDLRCGNTVRFLGTRSDVADLLRAADLFVLPSRSEGCNNALLEAMATGLAVVASDAGGTAEIVTPNRTGWLVPPENPGRLAETILAALLDTPARQRVGQAARAFVVRHFALDAWIRRYALLYRQLAGREEMPTARVEEGIACAG
jgi:glycosyltransferase involved in cell wall biosynthesis